MSDQKELLHQSIKGSSIACEQAFDAVQSTPLCAHVTCPECKAFVDRLVDAVFAPLD